MNFEHRKSYSRPLESSEPPTLKAPHPEYLANLKNAESFCARVDKKMQPGMRAYVIGDNVLPKSILYISWKPPKEHPAGMYATPIFLHDTISNVNKRIEGVFNTYMRKAKDWFDRHPQQPCLFEPGLNNMDQRV